VKIVSPVRVEQLSELSSRNQIAESSLPTRLTVA
jgi:hypothetical protein